VRGRLRVVNGQPPSATGATLADSGGLAHRPATRINSRRTWTSASMTPLLDGSRRKHAARNLPSDISFEKSRTRFPRHRKCETAKENLPIFSMILHFSLPLYKLHDDQVPLYGRACPVIPWHSGAFRITIHFSGLYIAFINVSPMAYNKITKQKERERERKAFKMSLLIFPSTVRRVMSN
jgi:hypothetical protein